MATSLLLEGDDLEALLQRAATEGGPSARIVRAEKTRQGGVMGFFAKERYEVAVEIPDDDGPATPGSGTRISRKALRAAGSLTGRPGNDDGPDTFDDLRAPRGRREASTPTVPASGAVPDRTTSSGIAPVDALLEVFAEKAAPQATPQAAPAGEVERLVSGELSPGRLAADGLLGIVDRVSAAERAAARSIAGQPLSAPQGPAFHVPVSRAAGPAGATSRGPQVPREVEVGQAAKSAAYAAMYAAVYGTEHADVVGSTARALVDENQRPDAGSEPSPRQRARRAWQAARFPVASSTGAVNTSAEGPRRDVWASMGAGTELADARSESGLWQNVPTPAHMVTESGATGSQNGTVPPETPQATARPSTARPEFTALLEQLRSGTRPSSTGLADGDGTDPIEARRPAVPVPARSPLSAQDLAALERERVAAAAAAEAAAADAARLVSEHLVAERAQAQRVEAERAQAERDAVVRAEAEQLEAQRAEAARAQAARIEAERQAAELAGRHAEEQRRLAARLAAERAEAEAAAAREAELLAQETARLAALDGEPQAIEAQAAAAIAEQTQRAQAQRAAAERAERERVQAETAARVRAEAERIAGIQIEAHRREAERLAAELAEAERVAAERAQAERIAAERAESAARRGLNIPRRPLGVVVPGAAAAIELEGLDDDAFDTEPAQALRGSDAQVIADRATLRTLGLPASWTRRLRPGDRFAAVLKVIEPMPDADIDPEVAVVAVVGPAQVVLLEAYRTSLELPIGAKPRPVVVIPATVGAARAAALARAQKHENVVVAIESNGDEDIELVLESLETVHPDAVIAVVDAERPLDQTQAWLDALGPVDALSLDGAAVVSAPAAVLQLGLPVIRLNGIPIDRVTWTALLCAQLEAARPAELRA